MNLFFDICGGFLLLDLIFILVLKIVERRAYWKCWKAGAANRATSVPPKSHWAINKHVSN